MYMFMYIHINICVYVYVCVYMCKYIYHIGIQGNKNIYVLYIA